MKFSDDHDSQIVCSFCGKRGDQVKRMLAGRNGYICDECIELCNDVLREEFGHEDRPAAQEQQELLEKHAPKVQKQPPIVASQTEKVGIDDRKDVDNSQNKAYIDVQELLETVTPDERLILEQLACGARHIDTIIAESGLPAGRILASMTLLEVKGHVKRLPGRVFSLAEKQ